VKRFFWFSFSVKPQSRCCRMCTRWSILVMILAVSWSVLAMISVKNNDISGQLVYVINDICCFGELVLATSRCRFSRCRECLSLRWLVVMKLHVSQYNTDSLSSS